LYDYYIPFRKFICLFFGKNDRKEIIKGDILTMFQKFAPLIILAMFSLGAYFMIQGMHHATHHLASPQKGKALKITE